MRHCWLEQTQTQTSATQHNRTTPGIITAALHTKHWRAEVLFSHADCGISHGDESRHQRCLFHHVSVLVGILARATVWGMTAFLCLEPHSFITFSMKWQESKLLKNYWLKSMKRFHFMPCEMTTNLKGCLKESFVQQNKAKPSAAPTPTGWSRVGLV